MSFALRALTAVALTHINIRRELHGEEHVPAIDMSMRIEGLNTILDLLDPELLPAIYCNQAGDSGQGGIEGVPAVLPNLRNPRLNGSKFSWNKKEKLKGYYMHLDFGLGDNESNIDLDLCTVTGFQFEAKEGGTVILFWTVQYSGERLTQEVLGKIASLTDEQIHITLIPPAVAQVEPAPTTDGDGATNPLPFDMDADDLPLDPFGPEDALARAVAGDAA